jgi:hypothetical protein
MLRDSDVIEMPYCRGRLFATFAIALRCPWTSGRFPRAWLVLTFAAALARSLCPAHRLPPAVGVLATVAAALCLGTATAVVVGQRNVKAYFIHDLLAYALVASISLLAVFQAGAALRLQRAAWFLVLFGSVCLGVQLAQAFGLRPIIGGNVWFYDRLTGWSDNANQLGLLCLILVLLSLHLAETAPRPFARFTALGCGVLPAWAGYLSRSDAFMLAVVLSVCCAAGLRWWRSLVGRRRPPGLGALSTQLAALALPVLLAASGPLAYVLGAREVAQHAHGETNEKFERDVGGRMELWKQALERGFESRTLGLGPGPHLVRPASLREPRWDALPDFEAHNTFVDMFLQGGVLAVASLLWLGATAARGALRVRLSFLPMLLIGMSGFALTHFVIRHPIVWFVVALALAAGSSPALDESEWLASRRRDTAVA